jgi:hypothetical protein
VLDQCNIEQWYNFILCKLLDWYNTGQKYELFCMYCLGGPENKFTMHVFSGSLFSSLNNSADFIVLLSNYFSIRSLWHVRHLCMSYIIRYCVKTVSNYWMSLNLWSSRFCYNAGKRHYLHFDKFSWCNLNLCIFLVMQLYTIQTDFLANTHYAGQEYSLYCMICLTI